MTKRRLLYGMFFLLAVLLIAAAALMRGGPHGPSPRETEQVKAPRDEGGIRNTRRAPVEFVGERIDIAVREGAFTVTGRYTLRWNDPSLGSFPLIYPFPVDEELRFPETVSVTGADSSTPVPCRSEPERGFIAFTVKPGQSETFTVCYTQKISGSSARYILTSTKAWGTPLERAVFTVTVPAEFRDVELSYKPDSVEKNGDTVVYTLTKTDFMPDRDLVITWNNDRGRSVR